MYINTDTIHTFHTQSDDIDIWLKYRFVEVPQVGEESHYKVEWVGEVEVTFATGKLVKLTIDEYEMFIDFMSGVNKHLEKKFLDERIDYLEKQIELEEHLSNSQHLGEK